LGQVAHVTRDSDATWSEGQISTCCWCLKWPICWYRCHLANKYKDIVNLQGGGGISWQPPTYSLFFSYFTL